MLGAEIGFEDPLDGVGRNSPGIVLHCDDGEAFVPAQVDPQPSPGLVALFEGLFGVLEEVEQHLGQFVGDPGDGQGAIPLDAHFDPLLFQSFADQGEGVLQAVEDRA